MGTICILLGLIIFLGSLFLGFAGAGYFMTSAIAQSFVALSANAMQTYILFMGVCGFIGLLICLNLVMHGLTFNKVAKMASSVKKMTKRAAK